MKAHVICMNDAVMAVVLDDEEKANLKLIEMRLEHFNRNPHGWSQPLGWSRSLTGTQFDAYCSRVYWHIHTVETFQ